MDSLLNGIISGVVLAFLIGPVFFTLLQTSIERGFRCGLFVAIGISLSDAFYISVCYLGVSQLFDQGNFREYLGYFGGGVLLTMGLYYLLVKSRKLAKYDPAKLQERSPWQLIVKGFIVNGLTPTVLIFWLGAVGVATTRFGYVTATDAIPYFSAIVCTVFLTDVLKAKLAAQLRNLMTPGFIRAMNLVLGLVLVIFGGRLIFMADELHLM